MDTKFISSQLCSKNTKIWIWFFLFSLSLFTFLIFTSEVQEASAGQSELVGQIDSYITHLLPSIRLSILNGVAVDITALGSTTVLSLLIAIILLFFFLKRKYQYIYHLCFAAVGSAILTEALKLFFERPRPDTHLRLVEVSGYSYPSGHSLASAAIYFTIAVILCHDFQKAKQKILIVSAFLFLIALISISRIYLGVHYFSDVLAGVLLGICWASFLGVLNLFYKKMKHD